MQSLVFSTILSHSGRYVNLQEGVHDNKQRYYHCVGWGEMIEGQGIGYKGMGSIINLNLERDYSTNCMAHILMGCDDTISFCFIICFRTGAHADPGHEVFPLKSHLGMPLSRV